MTLTTINKESVGSKSLYSSQAKNLSGTAIVSGDKSISHRAVMLAGIASGISRIEGLLESEDVLCTIGALQAMGAKIKKNGILWQVEGVGSNGLQVPIKALDMGNSGTSTRLLAGLVAPYGIRVSFIGDDSLSKRPMGRVIDPLRLMGVEANYHKAGTQTLPLTIEQNNQPLQAIEYRLPVASAQVKSAILLAGLGAQGTTILHEPIATRDHTEIMLPAFGVTLERIKKDDGGNEIHLRGGQKLTATDIIVPADPSSAAFAVVAALIVEGSDIVIPNVMLNPTRAGLIKVLQQMGGAIDLQEQRVQGGEAVADLRVRSSVLQGINIPADIAPSMIDEYPILAVAAAFANGKTHMAGLAELRVKESDRLRVTAELLQVNGVEVETGLDYLTVTGQGKPPLGGGHVKTYLDHRIAMAALVMGMASAKPIMVDDASPIATSFPEFVDLMNGLGASIRSA